MPDYLMIEVVGKEPRDEEHATRVLALQEMEKQMGIVRQGGQACTEPSAIREGHNGMLLAYDEEQHELSVAKLLLRPPHVHEKAERMGKDGCAARWRIEVGDPPREVTAYVYPALDDEEVQLLELTELVRMARQPDAVAETVGAGEAVAVRLKETERHTVIKVVVRQLGKLPRKKSQEGARMTMLREMQYAVMAGLRIRRPDQGVKWAIVAGAPVEWTEGAQAPKLMEIPEARPAGTAEAAVFTIEGIKAGPVEVLHVEKSADGRLVLDTALPGAKPRKLNMGMAGKQEAGGRAMASVIGKWHACVPVEHKEWGALRKPHGQEMCPAPIWAKRKKAETADGEKLELIIRHAEYDRVGPTGTCPFYTIYTGMNGFPSRCIPFGGCYGRLASCYKRIEMMPTEYEKARSELTTRERARTKGQQRESAAAATVATVGGKGGKGGGPTRVAGKVEVMGHGGGRSPARATARGKKCDGCGEVGAEGAGMEGEAGWRCEACWTPKGAEEEGDGEDEEEDGNAVMVAAGVVEGQGRPEAPVCAAEGCQNRCRWNETRYFAWCSPTCQTGGIPQSFAEVARAQEMRLRGQQDLPEQEVAAEEGADDAGDDDRYSVVDGDEEMEDEDGEEGAEVGDGGKPGASSEPWRKVPTKAEKKKKKKKKQASAAAVAAGGVGKATKASPAARKTSQSPKEGGSGSRKG